MSISVFHLDYGDENFHLKKRWGQFEEEVTRGREVGDEWQRWSLSHLQLLNVNVLPLCWKMEMKTPTWTRWDEIWQDVTRGDKRWGQVEKSRTSGNVDLFLRLRASLSPSFPLSHSSKQFTQMLIEFCSYQVVACQNGQNLRISKFDNRTIRCYYRVQKIALCSPFTQNYEETFLLWKHSKCVFLHIIGIIGPANVSLNLIFLYCMKSDLIFCDIFQLSFLLSSHCLSSAGTLSVQQHSSEHNSRCGQIRWQTKTLYSML